MANCRFTMLSRVLKNQTDFNVILPEAKDIPPAEYYKSGEKFKVLWLLHGMNGSSDTWLHDSKINVYVRGKPIIVVMPSGLNSFYSNYTTFGTGYDYPSYFFDELMPFIHGWLPASDKPEDNYLCGLSMGGQGTFQFAMMHPEKFGGIAPLSCSLRTGAPLEHIRAMSGYEFRRYAETHKDELQNCTFNRITGISDFEINSIAKYDTVGDYIDSFECTEERYKETALKLPPMFYGCGTEDPCYEAALKIESLAKNLGVKNAVFDYVPGYAHDSYFWDVELKKVLDYFHLAD